MIKRADVRRRRHAILIRRGIPTRRGTANCARVSGRLGIRERRKLLKAVAPIAHALLPLVAIRLLGLLTIGVAHAQQYHAVLAPLDVHLPIVTRRIRRREDLIEIITVGDERARRRFNILTYKRVENRTERRLLALRIARHVALEALVERRWQPRHAIRPQRRTVKGDAAAGVAREARDFRRLGEFGKISGVGLCIFDAQWTHCDGGGDCSGDDGWNGAREADGRRRRRGSSPSHQF